MEELKKEEGKMFIFANTFEWLLMHLIGKLDNF